MAKYKLTDVKEFKTPGEINKMNEKEAKEYIKEIRKEVYNRNRLLIKEGLIPLARIPSTTVRGKNLPALKKTIARIRNYLVADSTTVEGAKNIYDMYRGELGGYADELSNRNIGNIWKLFNKMSEAYSDVYQGGAKGKDKYRNAYLIAIATIQRADRRLNNSNNISLMEAIHEEVRQNLRGDMMLVRDENGNPLEKKDENGKVIPGEYVYETVEAYFMKRRKQFTRIGRP